MLTPLASLYMNGLVERSNAVESAVLLIEVIEKLTSRIQAMIPKSKQNMITDFVNELTGIVYGMRKVIYSRCVKSLLNVICCYITYII
jgi:predicted RNase H-related nuclease YkuK (DUF458 family)